MDTIILSVLSGVFAYGVVFLITERARKRRKANKDQLTEDVKNLTAERTRLYSSIEELGRLHTEAKHSLTDTIEAQKIYDGNDIQRLKDGVENKIQKSVAYFNRRANLNICSVDIVYSAVNPTPMIMLKFTME